jgi:hypothetical protein
MNVRIDLQKLKEFDNNLIRRTNHTFQKKIYEKIYAITADHDFEELTRVIMSTHFYLLLKHPFQSTYDHLLTQLSLEFVHRKILSPETFRLWRNIKVSNDKETLSNKYASPSTFLLPVFRLFEIYMPAQ